MSDNSESDEQTVPHSTSDMRKEEAKRLFDVSLDLLCVADPGGYFLQVNPEFERLLGYTVEELTSRPIIDFVHPDDHDATRNAFDRLADNEDVVGFTNRYICKDGSVVWLEWQSRSYPNENRVYASARNITELRRTRLERDRMEMKFQKAQRLESVAVLAGGIAHDFNNLLTTILGNAGLMSLQIDEQSPMSGRVDAIRRAASTAADLCEQLLAYAGEGQFDVEDRNLSDIVSETQQLLGASVSQSATLEFELADELPVAELDTTQIRQILMNVVQNASEALGESPGTIRITTGQRECDHQELEETLLGEELDPGNYVFLEVSDTGCGMTSTEIRRIFNPFFSTKFTGRGLGLAATLGIVRAHDGTLRVESQPDEGTSFRFYFPARQTRKPFTDSDAYDSPMSFDDQTVLIADEEADIVQFLQQTLERKRLGVLDATDAEEALELFEMYHDEIAAVILDVSLPNSSDEDILGRLNALNAEVPVILSSGFSESHATGALPADQYAGFLQKPYGPDDLLRTLSRIITR